MTTLNRAQRVALKRVFDRQPLIIGQTPGLIANPTDAPNGSALTYRQFRRSVRAGYGCVMVPWCGMWLGIEPDGHTHS